MMKPVFFPFTVLSAADAARLKALFPSVVVYQPARLELPQEMQPFAASGFLDTFAPDPADDQQLETAVRELTRWAQQHREGVGIKTASAWGPPGRAPLFEDESAARIVSEIRHRMTAAGVIEADARLSFARLFLRLAQEFDCRQLELHRDLDRCDQLTDDLFTSLRGEPPGRHAAVRRPATAADAGFQGAYLLAHRLAAWSQLYLSRPYPSAVFITHSPELVEHMMERVPQLRRVNPELSARILTLQAASALEALVSDSPAGLAAHCTAQPGEPGASIFALPGLPPPEFFARFAPGGGKPPPGPAAETPWRNTVIISMDGSR
jgi:hypothetical protein